MSTVSRRKSRDTSEEVSSSSSSEEDEKPRKGKARAAETYRVAQITGKHKVGPLDMVTLPMQKAVEGRLNFLLDSGATLTLIKVGNLKGKTMVREEKLALIGVTGHQIHTIGKIKATVDIGNKQIRHTMYVVKNNFPIEYEGILGNDFLTKHKVDISNATKRLKIGTASFKLRPYRKVTLPPHSETIVEADTDHNRVGIVKSGEPAPGVFIGHCLVKPIEFKCPVSILNVTDKPVEIVAPHVTLEDLSANDTADILTLRAADEHETVTERQKKLREQVQLDHLNAEERKAVEQICDDFCDVFYLDGDKLSATTAIEHEINTRPDSAPVNVRPY